MKKLTLLSLTVFAIINSELKAQSAGINTTGVAPNASALLDVDAAPNNNKGLLIPRIPLTATNNNAPVGAGIANSLLVFNTATVNDVYPGYYYWDGTKWVRLVDDAWQTLGNTGTNPATNFLGTIDNQDLVFRTNNLERMRVLNTGNVGIATAAPTYQLQVDGLGSIAASNFTGGVSFVRSISNSWAIVDAHSYTVNEHPAFVGMRGRGTNLAPTYPIIGDVLLQLSGRDVIDGYIATGNHGGAGLLIKTSENWTTGAKGGEINFYVTSNNTNNHQERMIFSNEGYLGIGTNLPQTKLHINHGVNSPFMQLTNGVSNDYMVLFGTTFVGYNNPTGIVYHEIAGPETHMFGGEVIPDGDDLWNLGAATKRWKEVFAANGVINTSDLRQKKNINPLNYGLNDLMKLKPITYQWKNGSSGIKLGFIAQDLLEVIPEVVYKNENESTPLGVYYSDLIPLLTKSIQDQQKLISQQNKEIESLKKELSDLKSYVYSSAKK